MHVLRCPMCWRLGGCTELGAGRSKVHFGDLDDRLKLCGMTFRVSSGGRSRWPSSRSPKCTFSRRRPRTLHPRGVTGSSSWCAQRDRQGPLVQFAIQRAVRHFLCKSRTWNVKTCSHSHATAYDRRSIGTLGEGRQAGSLRPCDPARARGPRKLQTGAWR